MATGTQLAIIFNGQGKRQSAKDVALDLADLDTRLNVTSRNWINTEKTIDEILDCNREEVVFREVTRIIRRLPIEGEFVPQTAAPLSAYSLGQAAAPSGTTANFVKTFTVTHTSGEYQIEVDWDGIVSRSAKIPFDASADKFRNALSEAENIGYGNITVARANNGGGGYVYTVTAKEKLAGADLPNASLTVIAGTAAGGAVVIAQTTAGSQKEHLITEVASRIVPYTTFGIGFADEAGSERLLVGSVLDNFRVTGSANDGKVTFAADIVARDKQDGAGLVVPDCQVFRPVRLSECILEYKGVDKTNDMTDFQISHGNGILTGNSAYTSRSKKPTRLERAARRTRNITFGLRGGVTTQMFTDAENNPEANELGELSLRVGGAGNNLKWIYPNSLLELTTGGGGLTFDGESEETVERFNATATKQGADATQEIEAHVSQSAAFLGT